MKKISQEIEKRVCEDYLNKKYSSRELGIKYSLNKSTILRILERNNIPRINHRLVNQNLDINFFETIDTEEKAYFLGFIFADGSVSAKGYLTIDINERDIEILQKFRSLIKSNGKITTRQKGNSIMSCFSIKNNIFVSHLNKYGIIPNKTKNTKNLPINFIPENLYAHFARGLIDGDGWISRPTSKRYYYHIGFVTNYKSVAEDFVTLINKIIDKKWTNKIIDRKSFVVQIQSKEQVKQLAHALYANSNICLSRKLHIAQEIYDSKC